MAPLTTWTQEMDATLREKASTMAYADIGKLLGVSKSAISGRASRLGIAKKTGPRGVRRLTPEEYERRLQARRKRDNEKKKLQRRAASAGLHHIPKPIKQRQEKVADVVPLHIAFEDLAPGQCRYPYGDELPYTFCGCQALSGLLYCEPHQRLTRTTVKMTGAEFIMHRRAFRAKLIAEAA